MYNLELYDAAYFPKINHMPNIRTVIAVLVSCGLFSLAGFAVFVLISPPRTDFPLELFEGSAYEADPSAGYRLRMNVAKKDVAGSVMFDVFTDSRGARINKPGEAVTDPAVVTIGCSQSFGQGIQNEKTFTQLLGISAVNLSVPSYGTASSLARLRSVANLHPKFVIYALWADHFYRNVQPCIEIGGPLCIERPYVRFASSQPQIAIPHTTEADFLRARDWFMQTSARTGAYRNFFTDMKWTAAVLWHQLSVKVIPDLPFADRLVAMNYLLGEMKAATDAMGAKLLVVYLPYYQGEEAIEDTPQGLVSFLQTKGIAYISMADAFRDMRNKKVSIAQASDMHLSEAAHERIAREIRQAMPDLAVTQAAVVP